MSDMAVIEVVLYATLTVIVIYCEWQGSEVLIKAGGTLRKLATAIPENCYQPELNTC
jgi:uncharacterized protein (UPF0218 family)